MSGLKITETGLERLLYNDVRKQVAENWLISFPETTTDEKSVNGRLISEVAFNVDATNALIQIVESQFHPSSAVGDQLSRLAILMGDRRRKATKSSCLVEVTTNASGATIPTTFLISDGQNEFLIDQKYGDLRVDPSKTIELTFNSVAYGEIKAPPYTLNQISTPVFGIEKVVNKLSASVGLREDADSDLRFRLLTTSAFKSGTIEGVWKSVFAVEGVNYLKVEENYTNTTNAIGMPPHSVLIVADGGDENEISLSLAQTVAAGIGYTNATHIPQAQLKNYVVFSQVTGKNYQVSWTRSILRNCAIVIKYNAIGTIAPDAATRIAIAVKNYIKAYESDVLTASMLYCVINQANSAAIIDIDQVLIDGLDKLHKEVYQRLTVSSLLINDINYTGA